MYWRKVMGLDSLKNSLSSSRLVHFHSTQKLIDLLPGDRLSNSGGNILLFWDVIEGEHVEIWCAEISLERRKGPEIWGNIERSHAVMTVDPLLHHYKEFADCFVSLSCKVYRDFDLRALLHYTCGDSVCGDFLGETPTRRDLGQYPVTVDPFVDKL